MLNRLIDKVTDRVLDRISKRELQHRKRLNNMVVYGTVSDGLVAAQRCSRSQALNPKV